MDRAFSDLDPRHAWEPAPAEVWSPQWAAHLYRRAAFGFPAGDQQTPSWKLLQQAASRGRDACVEELVDGKPGHADFDELMHSLGERIASIRPRRFQPKQPEKLQGWWLYAALNTPHPLQERMTLFWHDHFATSVAKVGDPSLMFRQNQLLRRHALGRFGPLLHGISRDPAMLVWLDSNSNVKGRPNENLAREIMELFSLGVGNYTEKDVQEAARAFTGWGVAGGEFRVTDFLHDDGEKTVLGTTGKLDGADVVDILLKQPATARFLARKLFAEFVSEAHPPSDELLEPLAARLRETGYDLSDALRTILRSRVFYSADAYRTRIKSPVEYVLGMVRAFDARVAPDELAGAMDGLGQTLFAPPNVAGWDGGTAWLNSATLLARHNFAAWLLERDDPGSGGVAGRLAGIDDPAGHLLELLVQDDVSPAARERVRSIDVRRKEGGLDVARVRTLAHTVLTMPEYQLA